MPREIVHWDILEAGLSELEDFLALSPVQLAAARLGAMMPDVPYYHRLGHSEFTKVGEMLHGANGENTSLVVHEIAKIARSITEFDADLVYFLLLGYLSHVAVDVTFHPMIFALSGDYYHSDPHARKFARTLHRLSESSLDEFWAMRHRNSYRGSVKSVCEQIPFDIRSKLLQLFDQAAPCTNKSWADSMRYLEQLQALFINPRLRTTVRYINILSGTRLTSSAVLMNFTSPSANLFWESEIRYRHPVLGITVETNLAALRKNALILFLSYASALKTSYGCAEFTLLTPSLNHGVMGQPNSAMKCFDAPPEFLIEMLKWWNGKNG